VVIQESQGVAKDRQRRITTMGKKKKSSRRYLKYQSVRNFWQWQSNIWKLNRLTFLNP
jgi:hypothetical protein